MRTCVPLRLTVYAAVYASLRVHQCTDLNQPSNMNNCKCANLVQRSAQAPPACLWGFEKVRGVRDDVALDRVEPALRAAAGNLVR